MRLSGDADPTHLKISGGFFCMEIYAGLERNVVG